MFLASVNLSTNWSSINSSLTSALGGSQLSSMLAIVGTVLVVFAVAKWLWDRRRNQGGNHQALLYTLVFGGVLAAPDVIIPMLLSILDVVINLGINLVNHGG